MKSVTSRSQKRGVGKGDSKIAKNSYFVKISWIIISVPLHIWTWNSRVWCKLYDSICGSRFVKIAVNRVGQLHQNHEKSGKSGGKNRVSLKLSIWKSKKAITNLMQYSENPAFLRHFRSIRGKNRFWAFLHGEKRPQSFLVFFLFIYGAKLDWI